MTNTYAHGTSRRPPAGSSLRLLLATTMLGLTIVLGLTGPVSAQTSPPVAGVSTHPPSVVGDSLTVGALAFLPSQWHVDARNGRGLYEAATFRLLAAVPDDGRCVLI